MFLYFNFFLFGLVQLFFFFSLFIIIFKFYSLFIYFWLYWAFVAVWAFHQLQQMETTLYLQCVGFSLWQLLLLQNLGSRAHGL